jgi:hypothetical protein
MAGSSTACAACSSLTGVLSHIFFSFIATGESESSAVATRMGYKREKEILVSVAFAGLFVMGKKRKKKCFLIYKQICSTTTSNRITSYFQLIIHFIIGGECG